MKWVSTTIWPANGNSVFGESGASRVEREKKIGCYDFAIGSFARIEISLTLEIGNESIFSFEISSVILWFFDQSEFEKIEKKMKLN